MRALLVVLLFAGCCPHDGFQVHNGPLLHEREILLAVADTGCGLRGDVTYVDGPVTTALVPGQTFLGYCFWDECGMEIRVMRPVDNDACSSVLGHELGHWCGRTKADAAGEKFANEFQHRVYKGICPG